ncbi:MAG: hypothetical protein U1E42_09700 [Rhodospirillales bacterium]
MKREINGHVYDTADAKIIASHERGSTHIHRLSSLYRSPQGRYFVVEEREIHGVDGALVTPLTDAMAREWLENHGKADLAGSLFRNGRIYLRIEIDAALLQRIDAATAAEGVSEQTWVLRAIETALAGAPEPTSPVPVAERQWEEA